ncbi:MAG: SprT family zinc-dependent metalloprotease [Microscillaceae bacterium]|nr:SprT family zinc-dependent metalloprotease [Microscillaceae bacterium]
MKTKRISIPKIGEITFVKSTKTRRLSIRIRPLEGVKVTFPESVSFKEAQHFVEEKSSWIQKHLPRIQHIENQWTIFDENTTFRTREHQLEIIPHSELTARYRVGRQKIQVYYPRHRDIHEEALQEFIREAIEEAWRREAKKYLPLRLAYFAQKHNFRYQNVFIKNTKTRWGSCSSQNNINLSLHLMRLPDPLIDYVLLHELCHTVEKNHGKNFWALLDQVTGDARGLDKQLSQYYLKIY